MNEDDAEDNQILGHADGIAYVPVTFEHFEHIAGPFYHGTRTRFDVGAELAPGHGSTTRRDAPPTTSTSRH